MPDEIPFQVYEEKGAPLKWLDGTDIPATAQLQVGMEVVTPTLFGYVQGKVALFSLELVVQTGGSVWFIERGPKHWISWGGGNIAAIEKIQLTGEDDA